MTIRLYNTLTRKLDEFKPLEPGRVGFYSCGPTVYHYAHIGNLRAYLHADQLRRMLLANGYDVRHVMNITDVGHLTDDADSGRDKMEKGAARENKPVWDIAKMFADAFFADTDALNIIRPTVVTKATDYIAEQIGMVKKLEELGYAYRIDDGIYYDTSKFADYGKLTGGSLSGNIAGARVEFNGGKKNPTDFALWKFSPKDEKRQMEWDSPWGVGFPGWHIECSAMSMAELGPHFDIHTGGIDHIPIHHTNEIAQSEPIVGKPWVNYWLHFEHLLDKSGKMSKSNGEFLTLPLLEERGYDPMHYRHMISLGHFGSQIVFSWESLNAAKNGYDRIVRRIADIMRSGDAAGVSSPPRGAGWREKILAPMSDNLHSSDSIAAFQAMLRDETLGASEKLGLARFADDLLGLRFLDRARALIDRAAEIPPEIKEIADRRSAAKAARDFAGADAARDELAVRGWTITDTPRGYSLSPSQGRPG